MQRCAVSPLLFNHYLEVIKALTNRSDGININGAVINKIRYADDTLVLAYHINDLQKLIKSVTNMALKRTIKRLSSLHDSK